MVSIEWKCNCLCKVIEVQNGLVECQVLKVFGIKLWVGRRFAPVPVCILVSRLNLKKIIKERTLYHNNSALHFLCVESGDGSIGKVSSITGSSNFTRSEEDHLDRINIDPTD